MSESKAKDAEASNNVGWKLTLIIGVVIILVTVGVRFFIYTTEPTAQRVTASKRTPMLVETTQASFGDFSPKIVVMGSVQAKDEVSLSPRVSGEVVEISPYFETGRFVRKGDELLKLDPTDYKNTVAQRRSELHQAEAQLAVEMGYQNVAQQDYELLGDSIPNSDKSLALREPQLKVARAAVEAAQSALDQAMVDLERTSIRAPFNAQILSRNVTTGSQVSTSTSIARLVGTDAYWVTATVPLDKLQHIRFSEGPEASGSDVEVRNKIAWPAGSYREGKVDQFVGTLNSTTRLARVNIEIKDPLARYTDQDLPPLILDSLLEVTIEGKPLESVFRIDRSYLRQNDTVWLKENGVLRIAEVTVVFQDANSVYISEGLTEDAMIVTTGLSSIVEGAALRTKDETLTSASE